MEDEAPVSMSAGCMNNIFERLEAETRSEAAAPILSLSEKHEGGSASCPRRSARLSAYPFSEIQWKRIAKGVGMKTIDIGAQDEGKLYLLKDRSRPGAA